MVGFGGFSTEPPLLLLVCKGFWTWGLSFLLIWGACTMGAPIFTLVTFGGTWHLFIQYDSSPCHQPVSPLFAQGVDTTYDLGVSSPGGGITVACQHRLALGAFCSHTGYWVWSGGSSLAWASCTAYSCPMERLLHCCRGLWQLLGGLF